MGPTRCKKKKKTLTQNTRVRDFKFFIFFQKSYKNTVSNTNFLYYEFSKYNFLKKIYYTFKFQIPKQTSLGTQVNTKYLIISHPK